MEEVKSGHGRDAPKKKLSKVLLFSFIAIVVLAFLNFLAILLFRFVGLEGVEAFQTFIDQITSVADVIKLVLIFFVTVFWSNIANYFAEKYQWNKEYRDEVVTKWRWKVMVILLCVYFLVDLKVWSYLL